MFDKLKDKLKGVLKMGGDQHVVCPSIISLEEKDSGFKWSKRSLDALEGVSEEMFKMASWALRFSSVDFGVIEGLRSKEQQLENVRKGVSQTMDSYHLTGKAVDTWPTGFKGGGITEDHFKVAEAFRLASIECTVDVVWGAAWKRYLADYDTAEEAHEEYLKERKDKGKKTFIDAGHFEIHNV